MLLMNQATLKLGEVDYVYECFRTNKWKSNQFVKHLNAEVLAVTHVLMFHLEGKASYHINGKEYICAPGDVVWFMPGDEYHGECLEAPYRYIAVLFTLYEPFDKLGMEEAWSPVFHLRDTETINRLFHKIYNQFNEKKFCYLLEMKSALLNIFNLLFQSIENKVYHQNTPDFIKPAMELIQNHYLKRNIEVSELAKACGLSTKQFSRTFTKLYHTTPKKFIIQMKVDYAKTLLESSALSVSEITEKTAFSDIFYFSKTFKKMVGITPSEYRNSLNHPLYLPTKSVVFPPKE